MKFDKMTIPSSDVTNAGTLKGIIIDNRKKTIIVMVKDGSKVNISKQWGLENKEEINLDDRVNEQDFILSNWQLKKLNFYDGKFANDTGSKKQRLNMSYEKTYKIRMAFRDVKLAYENAMEVYKSEVSKEVNNKEDMEGFGNVHIRGIDLRNPISKIIIEWASSNPKYAYFERSHGNEENKITLYFTTMLDDKLWRLECIKPKRKAHERFIALLASMGHRMLGVSVEKTVVKKKRKYRRRIPQEEEKRDLPAT